jgi:hypothetical protein
MITHGICPRCKRLVVLYDGKRVRHRTSKLQMGWCDGTEVETPPLDLSKLEPETEENTPRDWKF